MDERKNNSAVEKKLKDKLKTDRARIQMGRISGFGLLEMSRQRLRPGMIEATTQPCAHCHGTGLVRSDDNLALSILRELEEEGVRNRSREVLVKAPIAISNYLINEKREHVARIETRYGMAVRIEADMHLISPDFTIEKFKTATRKVVAAAPVVSLDPSALPVIEVEEDDFVEEADEIEETAAEVPAAATEDEESPKPKKRRRRRRRRRGGANGENGDNGNGADDGEGGDGDEESGDDQPDLTEEQAPEIAAQASEPEPQDEPEFAASEGPEMGEAAVAEAGIVWQPESPEMTNDAVAAFGSLSDAPTDGESTDAAGEMAVALSEPVAAAGPEALEAIEPPDANEPEQAGPADVAAESSADLAEVSEAEPEEPLSGAEPQMSGTDEEMAVSPGEELAPIAANSPEPAEDEPAKPKRRGWWSVGG